MTKEQISAIINVLRFAKRITPLQKDILDTWNELQKDPFDKESAQKQIVSNNVNHPDVFVVIQASPDVVQKPFDAVTQEDMIFNLNRQLDCLAAKEMEIQINGNRT